MQYASHSAPKPIAAGPFGQAISAVLVLTAALVVAGSTVTVQWVVGGSVFVYVALLTALITGALAVLPRLPTVLGLVVWLLATPVLAGILAGPQAHLFYPGSQFSMGWLLRVLARRDLQALLGDPALLLYAIALGVGLGSGWLAWCVMRWRQPLLGLIPAAGLLATNVINYPDNQNAAVFVFLVTALLLMLWTSYQRAVAAAASQRMRFTDDVRPAFWTAGAVALVSVVLVGLLLPPMSHVDRTLTIQSGPIRAWGDLMNRLNRAGSSASSTSTGGEASAGLATDVALRGPIKETRRLVFTYTVNTPYGRPPYFRALNLVQTSDGRWRYALSAAERRDIANGQIAPVAEQYRDQSLATFTITMVNPPKAVPNVIVYPGELARVDRNAQAVESLPPSTSLLDTLDRVTARGSGTGTYHVTITYSTASVPELEGAGTAYPRWVQPYMQLPGLAQMPGTRLVAENVGSGGSISSTGYRSPQVEQQVRDLALRVTAGATNPYDKARAIESHLRSAYTYTLTPPVPPAGADPLEFFLFRSNAGYCEYFATAMGDMLRALNIPTRLVNGYSDGIWDAKQKRYVVHEDQAHTWVEVFFPHYGWIPFEPTPDQAHFPIARGGSSVNAICRGETACDAADAARSGLVDKLPLGTRLGPDAGLGAAAPAAHGSGNSGFQLPAIPRPPPALLLALAALALLSIVVAAFVYLRPTRPREAWARALFLGRLAGARLQVGDTPSQAGQRLALAFPEVAAPLGRLAAEYVVAAYAPAAVAAGHEAAVLTSWSEVRPLLLRRLAMRVTRR